jgi:hypothetical protein
MDKGTLTQRGIKIPNENRYFSLQSNNFILRKWRKWRCQERWEKNKRFGLVRLV